LAKSSKPVFAGKIIEVSVQRVQLPNGHEMDMEIVRHPGGAAVACVDPQQRICLLRHYRCVVNDWLWELPAGKLDQGEQPLSTAKRELQEEAGVQAQQWQALGHVVSSPGVFTERVYLYLATELSQVSANRDIDEVFELHWIPFDEALKWAVEGQLVDAKTIVGIMRANAMLKAVITDTE